MVIIMYISVRLWSATYGAQGATQIAGLSLGDTTWYLVLAETVVLGNIGFAEQVAQDVRYGSVAHTLGRPDNYLLYHGKKPGCRTACCGASWPSPVNI